MEPLHLLVKLAQQWNLIQAIDPACDSFRASLYADDAALLIKPSKEEWQVMNAILQLFADASGLVTNLNKTEVYPIRCDNVNLTFLTEANYSVSSFPCTYLGLPLQIRKQGKEAMQPLVQKVANRLPGWKRNFMTYPSRNLLIKVMLSALPTYFLINRVQTTSLGNYSYR